jgi:hypothetical protein
LGLLKSPTQTAAAITESVALPRAEQLGPRLASFMPASVAFLIAVEGTDEFSFYFREVVEGTIWKN